MSKTEAEQHAAVWGLVDKFITEKMVEAQRREIVELTSMYLALSHFANFTARAYTVLSESIDA